MPHDDDRPALHGRFRQAAVWAGAAGAYAAAQGLSAWAGQRAAGRGTRPQYQQFRRPSFAPPGAAFPVAWSVLNLTTATSAWRVWRTADPDHTGSGARREALAWWAAAVVVRSGSVPLAFGQRRLWAATADSALLCAMMTHYAALARRTDRDAALLALPEVAWTAFATGLSAAVAAGNLAVEAHPAPNGPGRRSRLRHRNRSAPGRDYPAGRVRGDHHRLRVPAELGTRFRAP